MSTPAVPTSHPTRSRRLWAVGSLTSVEFLENGMVMFAATQILDGLQLSANAFALAQTLYGAAAIVMLVQHQWMVERLGYRRFAQLSLAVFALGSLLACLADNAAAWTAGRALQGLGGATFFTAGRLAVSELAPAERGAGMKTFIFSLLGATAASPLLAATLLATIGWRGIFAFGVLQALGVALLASPHLSRATVPAAQRSREHWGWVGALAAGALAVQYALQAVGLQALHPATVVAALLGGAVLLLAFAWRQSLNDRPLINYRGLWQTRYLLGLLLYFCGYFLLGISGVLIPALLHLGLALPLTWTAAVTSASMFMGLAMAALHLALAQRWPVHRAYMLTGLLLYSAASAWLATRGGLSWGSAVLATLALGLAAPLFMGPVAAGTFAELAPRDFSHGYQVKNIVRQLGLSSSIAAGTLGLHALHPTSAAPSPIAAGPLSSAAALANCQSVFLAAAILAAPLSLLVLRQRVFR